MGLSFQYVTSWPAALALFPGGARSFRRRGIASVEHQNDAREVFASRAIPCRRRRSADEEQDIGVVRIALLHRDQHRLTRRIAVARLGMRQEGPLAVGPQPRIDGVGAFRGLGADQRPPATLERLLDQPRQDIVQAAPFQMINKVSVMPRRIDDFCVSLIAFLGSALVHV